ncbi:MAG: acyl-CoA desaturase [bacterium]
MEKLIFKATSPWFKKRLKELVDPYLKKYGSTGTHVLHTKAWIFMSLWAISYFVLATTNLPLFFSILLLMFFGAVIAGIGFNLMHDGGHESFSEKGWINDAMGFWLNILGGNIRIWKIKHNVVHHTYTNVHGYDTDISIPFIARLHPSQKWKPWMKFQHVYMWLVYGVFGYLTWIWYSDFANYFNGRVGPAKLNFKIKDHFIFWLSKVLHVAIFILMPHYFFGYSWTEVFVAYGIIAFSVGLIISTVFQLAHVVDLTDMVDTPASLGMEHNVIPHENAVHQILTTANFAPNSKFWRWYAGGLNRQIEHHLEHKISHDRYPEISVFVKQVCKEGNLPYNEFPTFWDALYSHYVVLKKLGKKPNPQLV